jgi:hypothetical protein
MSGFKIFDGTNWVDPCKCNISIVDIDNVTYRQINPNNCIVSYFDGTNWCPITCPCECPEGYTFNPATNSCELVTIEPASPVGGTTVPVVAGGTSPSYGSSGARLYEDISTKTFPLNGWQDVALCPVGTPYCTPGYQVYESAGIGTVLNINGISDTNNDVFTNFPATSSDGRLNIAGIWATGYGTGEWLPVEFCINIPTTQTYIFAIAGDNQIKASITSTTFNGGVTDFNLVNLWGSTNPSGIPEVSAVTRTFSLWHMFPITLPAGSHTLKLAGYDFGTPSAFGAEIYNIPIGNPTDVWPINQTLHAFMNSTAVTVADLEPFILFTTRDLVQTPPLLIPAPGETITWNCPDGTVFSECYGVPSCISVDSIPCSEDVPMKSTTEINIWYDSSGTMETTLPPLELMHSTVLKEILLPIYNYDEALYRERVKILNMKGADWDYTQRFVKCLGEERNFQRTADASVTDVIHLVFTDESVIYGYGSGQLFDNSSRAPQYDLDVANTITVVDGEAYTIKGTVFRINTGPNYNPGFKDLVQATFINNGVYTNPQNLSTYYGLKFNCNLDTLPASTPTYYKDQIAAAMKALGIAIPIF